MEIISTERLILRPCTLDEFESTYRILVEEIEGPGFTRAAYSPEFQFDLSLAQQHLGEQFGRPSIFLKASGHYIGYCLLMPRLCTPEELTFSTTAGATVPGFNSLEAEVGWAISERSRKNGYATEAARALIAYGFHTLRLPRIMAVTSLRNLASLRVMEKLDMQLSHHAQTDDVVGVIHNKGREREVQNIT